ncbi:hypothetical protein DFH07DRAFT_994336 [Mycena maculata]|uniref:DUF6535 domain-containing protein n=1 Tax=Mycena maculata TaxID=230809 RepID=A0AAD7MSH6_9AGAR|nr:hypothetical protein DFH07DRAFT_994336 [Mycena maculata]
MPEVPATSSSAWSALLQSALSDAIQPKIDRWRSGLDALLVFLGLFSGIVTAFFVGSLSALQPDETARTNELLANLTNIVVALSGRPNLSVAQPAVFQPDETDVRLNSFWSLSLVLSLSLAALAVVCRGFLNMAAFSRDAKALNKLVDIKTRWSATEKILGTMIEALPPLLVVPVLLFIVGLLDTLYSSVLRLSSPPAPILVVSGICLFFVVALVAFLAFALVDGSINPAKSPFQTTLSHILHAHLYPALSSLFSRLLPWLKPGVSGSDRTDLFSSANADSQVYELSSDAKIYHEVIQATHDDDILDHASAALFEVIRRSLHPVGYSPRIGRLADEEHATLLHLLSPEATIRSSRTAAQVIIRLHTEYFFAVTSSEPQIEELLPVLADAANKSCNGTSLSVLWESPFLRAMSIVVDPDLALRDNAPAVWVLASSYSSWEHLPSNSDGPPPPTLHSPVVSFVLKVVFAKIVEALADSTRATEAGIVDSILSPNFDLGESLDARHLLAAMLHSPSQDDLTLFVMWLSRTHAPLTLIRAAYDNVESITTAQLMNLTRAQAEMFPFIVAAIGQVCMAQDDFGDHELLLKLCTYTFFKAVPMKGQVAESRMHWGLFDLVDTILMVTHAMPLPDPGSPLLDDLVRVRQVVCMLSLGTLRGSAFSLTAPASLNRSASASVSFDNRMESLLAEFKFIYDHATRSTARPRLSDENPAQGG